MNTSMNHDYGGWLPQHVATGSMLAPAYAIDWLARGCLDIGTMGTGEGLFLSGLHGKIHQWQPMPYTFKLVDVDIIRTPAEDLARIREVLNPAVSDLATTFGVSRQSIYNWLRGEPVTDENASKLRDLAEAADILAHEGVVVDAALLKRKFAQGRTLMQVSQTGGAVKEAAFLLARIHKHEEVQLWHPTRTAISLMVKTQENCT